jgi:hypothetical protein
LVKLKPGVVMEASSGYFTTRYDLSSSQSRRNSTIPSSSTHNVPVSSGTDIWEIVVPERVNV